MCIGKQARGRESWSVIEKRKCDEKFLAAAVGFHAAKFVAWLAGQQEHSFWCHIMTSAGGTIGGWGAIAPLGFLSTRRKTFYFKRPSQINTVVFRFKQGVGKSKFLAWIENFDLIKHCLAYSFILGRVKSCLNWTCLNQKITVQGSKH